MHVIDVCNLLEFLLVHLEAFDLTVEYFLKLLPLAAELLLAGQIVAISATTSSRFGNVFMLLVLYFLCTLDELSGVYTHFHLFFLCQLFFLWLFKRATGKINTV